MELRPIWQKLFKFDWKFGLILLLAVCGPRFWLVLEANMTGNYSRIGIVMLVSALLPFVFLGKIGLAAIGIRKIKIGKQFFLAILGGLASSLFLFVLGDLLYGDTDSNWFYYIGRSYPITPETNPSDRWLVFLVTALVGMTFSPIGEEFFFRGLVHSSFANSVGENQASMVDSLAFAFTHVAHFGLIYFQGAWKLLGIPMVIWVVCMVALSRLFFYFKRKTNSLFGAVICHAAFNLGMIFSIFYLLGS